MRDGFKIVIGAGVTALLAWTVHGPLGQGAAFLAGLQREAQVKLAVNGLGKVHVAFPDRPMSRMAHLSGPANMLEQSDARKLLSTLPGSAGVDWGEGRMTALAGGSKAAPSKPVSAATSAPIVAPSPTPAVAALAAVPEPSPTPRATPKPVASMAPRPAPAMAIAAASGPVGPCQKVVDGAVGGRVMSFQSGSAWLNATSLAIIKDVAAALKGCKGYKLDIAGHTDNVGDEGINRIMSEERARRVRDALVAKGIAGAAVSAKGYGSSRPIRAGQAADPANRRITFTVSGTGA